MSRQFMLVVLATLSACASRPAVVAVVPPPPPPPAPVAPPMPAGAVPGMTIPARLADGAWPTPGRMLTPTGSTWNLRAALNVAALSCRGPEHDGLVSAYNQLLVSRRATLADTEKRYAAEWRASGAADWQDRYDDAMTRTYNFYGQTFARPGFCAAAGQVLAELATTPDAELAAAAPRYLAALEQPFTTFFAAYDAWRTGQAPAVRYAAVAAPVLAMVAPTPIDRPAEAPRLQVDPAVFRLP